MASQGPLSPGTVVSSDPTGAAPAWSNPGNATASDDARATCTGGTGENTEFLHATNFGFSVPAGATIDGLILEVERSRGANNGNQDNQIHLAKNGVSWLAPPGTNKSTGATFPASDAYTTYGSSSDLWGQTWTAADINHSGFGAGITAIDNLGNGLSVRIDHVRITVHYTEVTFKPKTTFIT